MLDPETFAEGLERAVENVPEIIRNWSSIPEDLQDTYLEDIQMYFRDADAVAANATPSLRKRISDGIFKLHTIWYR